MILFWTVQSHYTMNQTCSLSKLDQICLCQLYNACSYSTNHMMHCYNCLDSMMILHLPMKFFKACSSHWSWALGQVLVSFVWFLIQYPLSFEWGKSSKVPLNMHNLQSTFMIMFSYYTILPYFCEFEMGSIMHDSCVSHS